MRSEQIPRDSIVVAWRNILRIRRTPQLIVFATIQPVMFVLLFTFVFGGSIPTPGFDYVDYLVPGILVQTAAFGSSSTAIGLADDLKRGMVDRFRSLPMARAAFLGGRTIADLARASWSSRWCCWSGSWSGSARTAARSTSSAACCWCSASGSRCRGCSRASRWS